MDQYEIQYFVSDLQNQANANDLIAAIDENVNRTDSNASVSQQYLVSIPSSLDQIAAENLIYMAQDGQMSNSQLVDDSVQLDIEESECHVVEEVITATDWVQQQGEDRVEIPVDEICTSNVIESDDLEVPLPTDQDQYTTIRPYPCDFCSRRFRKKNSLTNHMVAHQNDRPHICKLCGSRYFHRSELLNHFKMHAHSQNDEECQNTNYLNIQTPPQASSSFRSGDHFYDQEWKFDDIETKPKVRHYGRKKKKIKEETNLEETNLEETNLEAALKEQDTETTLPYSITDPNKPFVCQQCGIGFTREKAYLSHVRIHATDNIFECKNCSETFWDVNALNEHQKIHQFEGSNSEYEPENDNENDTFSDNDTKYAEFYCHICGMSFHRHDLLKRHSKLHIKSEVEDKSPLHCCTNCSQTFVEALDLLAHAEMHTRYPSFKCVLCGESFFEEVAIKKHLSNVHRSELTENSCILCGKECRDRKALIKHSWDHSLEKRHSCSKCGKNFHNKARLKRHMASHRDKSVVCDVCHKEFPDGRTLSNHRHSHSNAPGKQFPCNECGKTFGSRSSQQIHIRIHTGERPYGCRFCWKAFADGGTLRKHERIHTGEKPYECSVCPRAFNQRVVLRDHIRSHHSSIDEKYGTYHCSVCQEDQQSSADLIKHLIQHSDLNTAMQRQPVTGPRKYKRRRKLKPHELERLKAEKLSSDIEYSDYDVGTDDILCIQDDKTEKNVTSSDDAFSLPLNSENSRLPSDPEKLNNSWQTKVNSDDSFKTLMASLENSLHCIDPLVVNNSKSEVNSLANNEGNRRHSKRNERMKNESNGKSGRRPKMIHTQKTRVASDSGKHKTKTMITRTEPTELNVFPHRRRNNSTSDFDVITPDLLPPSKIACSPVRNKQDPLSIIDHDFFKTEMRLEANSIEKELGKYNSSVLIELKSVEILRSPERSQDNAKEKINLLTTDLQYNDVRRSTRNRRSLPNRKYLEFETNLPSMNRQKDKSEKHETEIDDNKDNLFSCDMCAAEFSDRSQLLVHVHVHI